MSDFLLASINANPNDPVLKQLDEFGLGEAIREVTSQEINQLGKDALYAFQSVVPYRTGQLQSEHIQIGFASKKSPEVKIYVRDATHTASVTKDKQSSATIADILQRKNYKRSQPSEGAGQFPGGITGSTVGWVDKGFDLFLKEARKKFSFSG
jgi:hypothetical protein